MSRIKDRSAKALLDGRVIHKADIVAGGTTVPWTCVCRAEHGHDHAAIHEKFAERLEQRGRVVEDLHALVGRKGRVGLIRFTITDCNIQIHGPADFRLFVAWTEEPITGGESRTGWFSRQTDRPETLPGSLGVILGIEAMVSDHGTTFAGAIRRAGEFAST